MSGRGGLIIEKNRQACRKEETALDRSARSFSARFSPAWMSLGLAGLTVAVYAQVGRHSFLEIDDALMITGNPRVLSGLSWDNVRWAFTTFHAANWHPLTWLSHMLDVELVGASPGRHHLLSVLYHLLNTELLFFVLWRMTGESWKSAFVAALFGLHPLHVESVAWVAERKDLLSTLFWILTMGAYLRYVRRPGAGRYLAVAAAFALGLMCKPMLVTLPFVLLLLDWWPLGRLVPEDSPGSWPSPAALRRVVLEKLPLLGLSAISSVVTVLAQVEGSAVKSMAQYPPAIRAANAVVSYAGYLAKTVWPANLAVFYAHPASLPGGIPAWKVAGSILLLCGISFLVLRQGRRRPYLAVGWLWYLGTLVPVIGVVQAGNQAMADRYMYVPMIGLCIMCAWGLPDVLRGWRSRTVVFAVSGGVVLSALALASWNQVGYWRNDVSLYARAVTVTRNVEVIWNNLGNAYNGLGRHAEAVDALGEALRLDPFDAKAWNNLGVAYDGLGLNADAAQALRKAVSLNPNLAEAWSNLGNVYNNLGRYALAVESAREATGLAPNLAAGWINLGNAFNNLGEHPRAEASFREAIRIGPDSAEAWYGLALARYRMGDEARGREALRKLRQIDPPMADRLSGAVLVPK